MRIGMQAGAGAYSQEFEAEADYVGLYLMGRAGMAVDEVPGLLAAHGRGPPVFDHHQPRG